MARFNLVNFHTVCCIARLGTFRAAAQKLHASQPAITARVRELEDSLGITLFQRRGRNMELTVEGRKLVQEVEPIVAQLESAVLANADLGAARGIVRIGIAPVALRWFPQVIAQLQAEMPHVQYQLDLDVGRSIVDKLESGQLDVALVAGQMQHEQLVTQPLSPEELRWLMSAETLASQGTPASTAAQALQGVPVWLLPKSSILFPRMQAVLRSCGVAQNQVNTCTSMAGIVETVARSGGAGLMTVTAAEPWMAQGLLVDVPGGLEPELLPVSLAWHRDQEQSIVQRVVERIADIDRAFHATTAIGLARARRKARAR